MISRVVLDTNVLISGYLWKGKPRKVIQLAHEGGYQLVYCAQAVDELARVLALKFSFDARDIFRIVKDY